MRTLLPFQALFIFFIFVDGESTVNLSTTTECDSDCLKPTSFQFRRIPVHRSIEERQSTTLNFMRAKYHKQTSSRSEIWKWDYWCQLQPKIGSCSDKLKKFYYDTQLDQCVTFTYGGCNGNKNKFDSVVECERHCKGSAFMGLKELLEDSELCSLQPNAGLCLATFTKYYFDVNTETCKKFIYGGCGGNLNRFSTKYRCLKKCGGYKA